MALELKNIKKNLFLLVLLLVVALFIFYFKFQVFQPSARFILSPTYGQTRTFQGSIVAGMSVLDVVYAASAGNGFDFRYSVNKDGKVSISSIDGLPNSARESWHLYLNQKLVNIEDAGKIQIKRGDLVEAKYE